MYKSLWRSHEPPRILILKYIKPKQEKTLTIDNQNKKKNIKLTAAQTAVAMAVLTLISKCLGFVREMVMAGCFGTSYVVDAYVMAQNIPNILFAGILSAVSTSFMPLFSEKMEREGEESGNKFVNEVLNLLLKASIVVAIFGIVFAKQFVQVFASGFTGEQATLTMFFLRIAFLFLIFNSLNQLLTAYLHYKNVFLPQIAFGYLQNFIVISFVILGAYINEKLIIFGLLCSYILINLLLTRLANKKGLKRVYSFKNSGVAKQIMVLALPTFIGGYVAQINTYVDKMLASGLPEGSVAALNYALLIVSLVSGLTVSIISTITFPKLNQARAAGNQEYYNEVLSKSFNLIFIIVVPFALGAMAFSEEVVQVIYERGAFDTTATAMTAVALFWYSPHLAVSTLNKPIIQAYQSNKEMKTLMYIGFVVVTVNVCLDFLLIKKMGIAGLAFATSIAGTVGFILRVLILKKKYPQIKAIESKRKLCIIGISAGCSVAIAAIAYDWLVAVIWLPRLMYLGIVVVIASLIYIFMLNLLKIDELKVLWNIFKKR